MAEWPLLNELAAAPVAGEVAVPRSTPSIPDAGRVRTYALWAGAAGVTFFAVYPTLNWFTATRRSRLRLFLTPELGIPFMPRFIWAYLSMYVLFLMPLFLVPRARMPALGKQLIVGTLASGILFLLLPAELGFARVVPANPLYAHIFSVIFGVDRPYNLVPSLHVVWSCAIILACADAVGPWVRIGLYVWLAIVVVSTVLVHQHHLLDVVVAMLLVIVLRHVYGVPDA